MEFESITLFSYLAAFGAGVISFLSPCVLPIVPGYVSIVTGLSVTELEKGGRTHAVQIAKTTGLFVLGFGLVFVLLGMSASSIGQFLFDNQPVLTRVSGAVMLVMGAFMLGSMYVQAPWLYREARFSPDLGRFGAAAPTVAGAAFGFGWTPCIGPVLASILTVAASSGRVTQGGTLLAVYSLGLGVPFLMTGLLFGRMTAAFAVVKRHFTTVVLVSALTFAAFGIILLFDRLPWLTTQLGELLRAIGLGSLVELG